jgi:hypothetical protein
LKVYGIQGWVVLVSLIGCFIFSWINILFSFTKTKCQPTFQLKCNNNMCLYTLDNLGGVYCTHNCTKTHQDCCTGGCRSAYVCYRDPRHGMWPRSYPPTERHNRKSVDTTCTSYSATGASRLQEYIDPSPPAGRSTLVLRLAISCWLIPLHERAHTRVRRRTPASTYIPSLWYNLYACTYTYVWLLAMHCGRHAWCRGHLKETWSLSLSIELACLPFLLHATKGRNSDMHDHAILHENEKTTTLGRPDRIAGCTQLLEIYADHFCKKNQYILLESTRSPNVYKQHRSHKP